MENNRKKLLYSGILVIIFVMISFCCNLIVVESKTDTIINITLMLLSLIISVYFFVLSINNKIELKKHIKKIKYLSIVLFFFNIISGILGFIVYKNLNESKKKKRDLPVIEDFQEYNKYIYLIALVICLLILYNLSNFIKGLPGFLITYISILIIMVFVFKKHLIRDFKIFKKYFREYNSLVLKTWVKALLFVIIINLTIKISTGIDNASNQVNLQEIFGKAPILIAMLSMFYAPIAEELMFRGVFKKFLKNKWVFILISGFTFGLIHVIDDFKSVYELLYVFVYGTLGCYLAFLYYKTNNIFTNMYFHFLQNTLSVIGMIAIYFMQ